MKFQIKHRIKMKHIFKLNLDISPKEVGYTLGIIEKPLRRKVLDFLKKHRF